jgi:hypothetical protein
MKRFFLGSLLLVGLNAGNSAVVEWSGLEAQFVSFGGGALADGNVVFLGTFNTSGAFNFNLIGTSAFDSYAEVASFFTQYASTNIYTEEGVAGAFYSSSENLVFPSGLPMYIWAFNSSSASTASQWAIVGGTTTDWLTPADPIPGFRAIDIGVDRVIHFGSDSGIASSLGGSTNVRLAAIPEPASAVALAGVAILGFAATRRRRRAV